MPTSASCRASSANLRSSGTATLTAGVTGSLDNRSSPARRRSATAASATSRCRASLDAINGTLSFDAGGIRVDDVARHAWGRRGRVRRPHRDHGLRARRAESHRDRRTDAASTTRRASARRSTRISRCGARSRADARWDGDSSRRALRSRASKPIPNLFNFGGTTPAAGAPASASAVPLRFDIHVDAPAGSLRVENNIASIAARADLRLQGTYDRPLLVGSRRYRPRPASRSKATASSSRAARRLSNPNVIEPYFDIEAETRARVRDQTYRVTVGAARDDAQSDPDHQLGSAAGDERHHQRAARTGPRSRQRRAARRTTPRGGQERSGSDPRLSARGCSPSPFSAPVGKIAEEVLGTGTTVLIRRRSAPMRIPSKPSARLVIGKRHLEPRLPDLRADPRVTRTPRADHRPRVRPERPRRLDHHPERRPHRSPSTSACGTSSDARVRSSSACSARRAAPAPSSRRRQISATSRPRLAAYVGKPIVAVELIVEGQPLNRRDARSG